jgi:methionyl-tRNA formyltransferase
MKIVVLCNGPLSIPSLQLLIEKNSLAGIAVPLTFDPFPFRVQDLAKAHQIPFSLIHKPNMHEELDTFVRSISPDVVFVLLWPGRISRDLLALPKLGFYNWHPGLLPQYRGPDPVFWEIRNREPFGAITVHKMNEYLDRGPIAYVDRVPIEGTETHIEHWEKLAASATHATNHLVSVLPEVSLIPQDESIANYHREPSEADRTIDWKNQDADSVLALIRASLVYGGAIAYFRNAPIHILRASRGSSKPCTGGTIISTSPLTFSCEANTAICPEQIRVSDVQSAAEFCKIFQPAEGESLTEKIS